MVSIWVLYFTHHTTHFVVLIATTVLYCIWEHLNYIPWQEKDGNGINNFNSMPFHHIVGSNMKLFTLNTSFGWERRLPNRKKNFIGLGYRYFAILLMANPLIKFRLLLHFRNLSMVPYYDWTSKIKILYI